MCLILLTLSISFTWEFGCDVEEHPSQENRTHRPGACHSLSETKGLSLLPFRGSWTPSFWPELLTMSVVEHSGAGVERGNYLSS